MDFTNNINKPFIKIKKRNKKENIDIAIKLFFLLSTVISASFIIVIIVFISVKGITPFITDNNGIGQVEILKFLVGDTWLTGTVFQSNLYSVGFIIINTLYIVFLSLILSFPVGVLTALFVAKVAPRKLAEFLRTIVELLASIPSIIYGLFGSGVILVFVYNFSDMLGIQSKGGNSVIATVMVLALMTLPTITAISEVSIRGVGKDIEHGSLALGATKTQTNFKVILASAKSGIFTSAILGIGRALGEATAVSLVAGNAKSGPTLNFLETTSTLTSTMLDGLKETTGIDYDIRFSVGIVLMVVILITNIALNYIKTKVGTVDVK